MTDLNTLSDQSGTPEDVATLYSWANLHGAKYRDFSAARAQTREKTRLRAEQAVEENLRQTQEANAEQEAEQAAEARRAVEQIQAQADAQAEADAQAQAEAQAEADAQAQAAAQAQARQAQLAAAAQAAHQQQLAAQQAAEQAARQAAEQAARMEAEQAAHQAAEAAAQQAARQAHELAANRAAEQARAQAALLEAQQAARLAAEHEAQAAAQQIAQQRIWQQPPSFAAQPPAAPHPPSQPQGYDYPATAQQQAYRPAAPLAPAPFASLPPAPFAPVAASSVPPSQFFDQRPPQPVYPAPVREENPRNPWAAPDQRESLGRPAWLNPDVEPPAPVVSPSFPPATDDTLQGSRDRLTSRWFALRGVFDGGAPPTEAVPAPTVSRAPAMAVFSLAGGVGKTSLVATLGRALSARGERVLLVDTAAFGLLPFFFGATDQRPGLLRTFTPPGASTDAPIQMVTIDPDALNSETSGQESLSGEISKFARGASRVIVDLATASGATTRRIMRMAPLVLVPVIPDMNSVVSVSSIDAFFEHNSNPNGKPAMPYYVINQFDGSLPLHLDVREVLREQLGERLLPFALRRTPAISEALAEGMTVMDYAPNSPLAEDFVTLAGWVKSLSSPATTSYRGVRWSER